MSALGEAFGKKMEELMTAEAAKQAERIANERLFNVTEALAHFGVSRSFFKGVTKTYLPNQTKPKYAAKDILRKLSECRENPFRK